VKIYISADIEGVAGATHVEETIAGRTGYAELAAQMTAETAAACEGARAAGAESIWVQDAHDSGRNLVLKGLPEGVRIVRGWSGSPMDMVQELDGSFDAVCMVGYHAPARSDADPIAHSMSPEFTRLLLNDRDASEFLLNAYNAASVGVPVAFVSGDAGICADAEACVPGMRTVAVKQGAGDSTTSLHPVTAVNRIREEVEKALGGGIDAEPLPLPGRFVLDMEFRKPARAVRASHFPGAERTGTRNVRLEGGAITDIMRALVFLM
jgi:D-amino peptidase